MLDRVSRERLGTQVSRGRWIEAVLPGSAFHDLPKAGQARAPPRRPWRDVCAVMESNGSIWRLAVFKH